MLPLRKEGTLKIEARTGTRKVKHTDRFGVPADRIVNVVELWVDGVCFVHDCDSPEQARAMVVRMLYALGVE